MCVFGVGVGVAVGSTAVKVKVKANEMRRLSDKDVPWPGSTSNSIRATLQPNQKLLSLLIQPTQAWSQT